MNQRFKINAIKLALCLVYPALSLPAQSQSACDDPGAPYDPACEGPLSPPSVIYNPAAPAYPVLPPTLAPSVKPNILLHVDNSGSMSSSAKDTSGKNSTRIKVARDVATRLVENNRDLNWGLFSFDYGGNSSNTSATFYNEGGVLQRPVLPIDSAHEANFTALKNTIENLGADTNTPLGEAMVEMTRVWAGEPSYYLGSGSLGNTNSTGKRLNNTRDGTTNKYVYTSPIQYRCQRNFNIVITDGDPVNDSTHAGITNQYVPGYSNTLKYIDGITWQQRDVAGGPLLEKNFKVSGVAIQAAAKYAYMRDFKVDGLHGVDGDGKSWDDPRYLLQNIVTYTVGFAINKASIESAAIVGGGKYYTATDGNQLLNALNNAVSEIGNITSNAGGVATSGATLSTADKMFQPVFHPTGWYGELLCFKLNNKGENIGACAPNAGAVFPAHGSRNIQTTDGVGNKFAFTATNLDTMSLAQRMALEGISPPATLPSSVTVRRNVINFIRGQEGITNFRVRPKDAGGKTILLADIIDGQPLTIGPPTGYTSDADYSTFKSTNSKRGMVFIGANGGMLHGFTTNDMTEIFGFVPSPVYPQLKQLTAADYGSMANPHAYHVNGVLQQQDVKLDDTWTTLLVGGLAQGGQGYFALDASNTTTLSAPATAIKWEFTDRSDNDLGYTFGSPIIYNVRTSSTEIVPAVLLANGYKSDFPDHNVGVNKSVLFIVNANDGTLLKKITAPFGWGLSSPFGVDYEPAQGADGVLDYVYAGDQSGRLWRFDLTSPIGAVSDPHLVFSAGSGHPIIQKPVVKIVKDEDGNFLGNLVIFGTGSLLEAADRLDNTTQTLYAVLDKMGDSTPPVSRANLAQRKVEEAVVVSGGEQRAGTYRRIEPADPFAPDLDLTDPTSSQSGWYLDLPVLSERLSAMPLLYDDRVLFGTGIPNSQEVCNTGYGWLLGLDPLTGLVVKGRMGEDFSFFDVKIDGKSTAEDMVLFPDGNKYHTSGYKLDGISVNIHAVTTSIAYPSFAADNSNAAGLAFQDANAMSVTTDSESPGKGSVIFGGGTGDGAEVVRLDPTKVVSGVKIETTIWREIR